MENDIIDFLIDSGYLGNVNNLESLEKAVNEGVTNTNFSELLVWLCNELITFYSLECGVHSLDSDEDSDNFLTELSGLLRELTCPHLVLTEGLLHSRFENREKCLLLVHYLCGELQAARLTAVYAQENSTNSANENTEVVESELAKYLRLVSKTYGLGRPPPNLTSGKLFERLTVKTKSSIESAPADHIGSALLQNSLTERQWGIADQVNDALIREYKTRRETLLKRLDVTVQSFLWGDKGKKAETNIGNVFTPLRQEMVSSSPVTLAHILAARNFLLLVEKIDSGEARKRAECEINKVLMGRVPDRGGRAWEMEPPPPEMPAFRKREAQPQRSQSGGRGGRGGRGGGGDRGHYRQDKQQLHSAGPAFHPQPQGGGYPGAAAMFGQPAAVFTPQYAPPQQYYNGAGAGYGGGENYGAAGYDHSGSGYGGGYGRGGHGGRGGRGGRGRGRGGQRY